MAKAQRDRFVDSDGNFVPSQKLGERMLNIKHLTEICEWVYYHNNLTDKQKLKRISDMEGIVQSMLNEMISIGCTYHPTWSVKLKRLISIKKVLKKK